ncbi:MAG: hypothetical protein ACI9EB_001380 [Pseudomonas sp.]|jgi:hypothetical protein
MKRIFPNLLLACSLPISAQVFAGDLLHLQDNSITYLNGSGFNELNFNAEEQK